MNMDPEDEYNGTRIYRKSRKKGDDLLIFVVPKKSDAPAGPQ